MLEHYEIGNFKRNKKFQSLFLLENKHYSAAFMQVSSLEQTIFYLGKYRFPPKSTRTFVTRLDLGDYQSL